MASRIKNATNIELFAMISSDINEIDPEIMIVTRNIVTTHRIDLFRSFFDDAGSDLDTRFIPFIYKI